MPPTFVAIDFETATSSMDSACAIGLARFVRGHLTERRSLLVQPPGNRYDARNIAITGITPQSTARSATFGPAWRSLAGLLDGAKFLVAHNAGFDRAVLRASLGRAGIQAPTLPWVNTVPVARRCWALPSVSLPLVRDHLGIQCSGAGQHHEAGWDAEVCGHILLRAWGLGWRPGYMS